MEALLRNLQEQEYHLKQQQQRFNIHDLANMEYINDSESPPPPPRRKYVSIFRIDGEPILPPLMTTEKRRQMQKIKEAALKVEQRIRQRKQRLHKEYDVNHEDIISITSRSSACNTAGNVSQRSHDNYEVNLKETEESLMLLQSLLEKQQGKDKHYITEMQDKSGYDIKPFQAEDNEGKLQKLQKSEILIFDNSTNEVIQITPDNETITIEEPRKQITELQGKIDLNYLQTKKPSHLLLAGVDVKGIPSIPSICLNPPTPLVGHIEEPRKQITELQGKIDLNYLQTKKPSHLLLAGVDVKGIPSIPSICLNPPTPLVDQRNICEQLIKTNEHNYSLTNSGKQNELFNQMEDISSDDSFNSMLTHTDRISTSKGLKTDRRGVKSNDKIAHKQMMNVSNKIQQFEALSSESNTPTSSPEKFYQPRKSGLDAITSTMNRSATSPSIKLNNSQRSSSSRSQSLAQDSDNSPETTLVRSSSFTLEGPSKVLLDHMRQQKAINEAKKNVKTPVLNTTRTITRKAISSPLRSHRDTVESKAKKVQKVELKSSKQKTQQKNSQSKLAQAAAAASLSPYNSSTFSQHSNHLYKTKKSPYNTTKSTPSSAQSGQKSIPSSNRKSSSAATSSSTSQTKLAKTRVLSSPMQTPTLTLKNSVKSPTGKESVSQMDKTQKEKFLKLLAQQEDEHRRLQQSFEMQQKMLIEQLNKEMGTIQIKSPINSKKSASFSFSTPSVSSQKNEQHQDQTSQLANQLQNQFNHSYSQQPSPTLSNNSSHLSFTISTQSKNMTMAPQSSSSFPTHHIPTASVASSNISLLDHSNANTSLDISTLSNQTSPDNVCATTPTNISNSHNKSSNKSSSRRRLFTSDVTEQNEGTTKTVSSRSTASSSSYPFLNHTTENAQQQLHQLHPNKSSMGLSHGSSNRRLFEQGKFAQHAAATKINACARGFLVRRLFQTEQIQRIVQTIRDTLIFVLNLHLETMENPKESHTPANIKLKARLLQQLTSACRTLHLVFFQTSIKERMEIIARDRKRIKTKLLSMNRKRTPRIAG